MPLATSDKKVATKYEMDTNDTQTEPIAQPKNYGTKKIISRNN